LPLLLRILWEKNGDGANGHDSESYKTITSDHTR